MTRHTPLGARCTTVLAWVGVRGVVTLALALSVPEGFPGRDFILETSFVVILGTVLLQATTLGTPDRLGEPAESRADKARMKMSQAEAAMAQAQLVTVQRCAYDSAGSLIHSKLLERYQRKASMIVDYAERPEHYSPILQAHFDVVLAAIATGRDELTRLHRRGRYRRRNLARTGTRSRSGGTECDCRRSREADCSSSSRFGRPRASATDRRPNQSDWHASESRRACGSVRYWSVLAF